jgi:hypothetical protein
MPDLLWHFGQDKQYVGNDMTGNKASTSNAIKNLVALLW